MSADGGVLRSYCDLDQAAANVLCMPFLCDVISTAVQKKAICGRRPLFDTVNLIYHV